MSAIDMLIGFASDYQDDSTVLIDPARAELAQQQARIAALERAVNEARNAIYDARELLESIYMASSNKSKTVIALRAWLSAYPAPQPPEEEVTL
jgi:hypothetical protein